VPAFAKNAGRHFIFDRLGPYLEASRDFSDRQILFVQPVLIVQCLIALPVSDGAPLPDYRTSDAEFPFLLPYPLSQTSRSLISVFDFASLCPLRSHFRIAPHSPEGESHPRPAIQLWTQPIRFAPLEWRRTKAFPVTDRP